MNLSWNDLNPMTLLPNLQGIWNIWRILPSLESFNIFGNQLRRVASTPPKFFFNPRFLARPRVTVSSNNCMKPFHPWSRWDIMDFCIPISSSPVEQLNFEAWRRDSLWILMDTLRNFQRFMCPSPPTLHLHIRSLTTTKRDMRPLRLMTNQPPICPSIPEPIHRWPPSRAAQCSQIDLIFRVYWSNEKTEFNFDEAEVEPRIDPFDPVTAQAVVLS